MGLLDNIRGFFGAQKSSNTESQIAQMENTFEQLKQNSKSSSELKSVLQNADEMRKLVHQKYKEIKKIQDPETFDIKARVVADMAMYTRSYMTQTDRSRWMYNFDDKKRELEFARPEIEADMIYRKNHLMSTIKKLQEIIPESERLLFHSTPISNAKSIIESQSLSSSADRYDGYNASTDGYGRISVADIKGLEWSASYWLRTTDQNMPCGVLFVLKEKYEGEYDPTQHTMDSIDFYKNPDQLEYIISTEENMPALKQLVEKVGFSQDFVITFEQFLEMQLEKHKEKTMREELESSADKNYIDHDAIIQSHSKDIEIEVDDKEVVKTDNDRDR